MVGCLLKCAADVAGVEVAGHKAGLALSAVEEAPCLAGEFIDGGGSGGVDVVFEVGVQ